MRIVRPLLIEIGLYAEEREKSYFTYVDKQGKKARAEIVDIWLAPVPKYLLTSK